MTTPAQQQQQQQPAPYQPGAVTAADTALALALATALLTALTPEAAMTTILSYCRGAQVAPAAMLPTLQMVMAYPSERTGVAGPASLITSRQNVIRRAQFAVAASHRLTSEILSARSRGESIGGALADGITAERRYFSQHIDAMWNRATAAAQVDSAVSTYGLLLGWNAVHDTHTSAECRAADGKNFSADAMPLIGWPGAVHPHCRCYPGPPVLGARMLPSAHRATIRAAVRAA